MEGCAAVAYDEVAEFLDAVVADEFAVVYCPC